MGTLNFQLEHKQAYRDRESEFSSTKMSDVGDTSFIIYYNGKFNKERGEVIYDGGESRTLHAPSESLFTTLMKEEFVSMYRQRIWYKLPYEDLTDLKLLCDGSPNFQNMCRAAFWTKAVEIFMEIDDVEDGEAGCNNDDEEGGCNSDYDEAEGSGDENARDNGDGAQGYEEGEHNTSFAEEERVEEIVAGFVDEEENDDYPNTPSNSDCDESDVHYERYRSGSGELKIMQVFGTVKEFKEAVLEYALKGGWNVKYKDTDSWLWFISKLKRDLKLGNGDGFTVISDRQKGLLKAIEQELPKVEHRMCARHLYGNLKKYHSTYPQMKGLFWDIANSFNIADYEASLEKMKTYNAAVYEALMMRNPKTCSRAFFKTTSCCEDGLNNFSESYNSTIEKARSFPLVEMLETIRRQCMKRIDARKDKAAKHKGKHNPKVFKELASEDKHRKIVRGSQDQMGCLK